MLAQMKPQKKIVKLSTGGSTELTIRYFLKNNQLEKITDFLTTKLDKYKFEK